MREDVRGHEDQPNICFSGILWMSADAEKCTRIWYWCQERTRTSTPCEYRYLKPARLPIPPPEHAASAWASGLHMEWRRAGQSGVSYGQIGFAVCLRQTRARGRGLNGQAPYSLVYPIQGIAGAPRCTVMSQGRGGSTPSLRRAKDPDRTSRRSSLGPSSVFQGHSSALQSLCCF